MVQPAKQISGYNEERRKKETLEAKIQKTISEPFPKDEVNANAVFGMGRKS